MRRPIFLVYWTMPGQPSNKLNKLLGLNYCSNNYQVCDYGTVT